jgi:osmotically-inducible protein OsmY
LKFNINEEMKSDEEIQKDVIAELSWEAAVSALKPAEIGVSVRNGVITLSGNLDSFAKKMSAEKAANRVGGVKAIANDILVKPAVTFRKSDTDIAEIIVNTVKWSTSIPEEKVMVSVEDGFVTLEGEVEWEFQKRSATKAIEDLRGVKGVNNKIVVVSKAPAANDIKQKIKSAIQRNAEMDANRIDVEIRNNVVVLSGEVRSMAEKTDAEEAVWSAPGVDRVENKLEVIYKNEYIL